MRCDRPRAYRHQPSKHDEAGHSGENVPRDRGDRGAQCGGQTTWCRRHAGTGLVPEYTPTGTEPDEADLRSQADYWVAVNSRRWARALAVEAATGRAICDSDPLKLHYSWCLSMIGAAPRARWEHDYAATRTAFAAGLLGLADAVFVSIPPLEVLRQHKDADPTRRRRHFDLHARLGDSLRQWYTTVDRLDPGRGIWNLPPDGIPRRLPPARKNRTQVDLLDALVTSLPRLPT
ncbi:hypothetical protein FHS29_003937 [Saccharothrix tamanrassetensis]|uniref:Uncharacterized protein n=1 Tax=Saccharothrix tamanrassetensis TaxID=1051531 RepID=A0A841CLU9_9PSEU|nr:hypothetical protein [Saccharothrix tamanrassetensis]MBB5957344.1 hypothetical protein [Saccharothrix tamanrassetensis]